MKAISLHQPWASMIARGEKTIETRWWRTTHRGDLLICSTKKPSYSSLPCGFAIAIVDVYDCIPYESKHDLESGFDELKARMVLELQKECDRQVWSTSRVWSWMLRDIRRITTVFAVHGCQGFFEVETSFPIAFTRVSAL